MEFCTLALKQLDEETADIKVAVNIEVLETLLRKNRTGTVEAWYDALSAVIYTRLEEEFGEGPESLAGAAVRALRGHNTAGIPFVSVVAMVHVSPEGGDLTETLSGIILQHIKEAMEEKPKLTGLTGTSFDKEKVAFRVEFDRAALSLDPSFLDDFIAVAKQELEEEIRKEYWKMKL